MQATEASARRRPRESSVFPLHPCSAVVCMLPDFSRESAEEPGSFVSGSSYAKSRLPHVTRSQLRLQRCVLCKTVRNFRPWGAGIPLKKNTASEKPRKGFFKTICIARRRNERMCLMQVHKNQTKSPAPFPDHAEISGTPASDAHRASPQLPETPSLPRSDRFLQPFLQGSPEKAPTGNASRQLPSARFFGFPCPCEAHFPSCPEKNFFPSAGQLTFFPTFFFPP